MHNCRGLLLLAAAVCVLPLLAAANKYCNLRCPGNKVHTICRRNEERCLNGPNCGKDFRQWDLGDLEQQFILDKHNMLRNTVASGAKRNIGLPPATHMKLLTYNHELAMIAQCWVNECQFGNDVCRRTSQFKYVGQNTFIKYTTANGTTPLDVLEQAFHEWEKEETAFGLQWLDGTVYSKKLARNHFTQLVWANTMEVGCGLAAYSMMNGERFNVYYLACNYGPSGNMAGREVYRIGDPECRRSDRRFQYLCID